MVFSIVTVSMTYKNRATKPASALALDVAESQCQGTRQQSEWSLELIFDLRVSRKEIGRSGHS